MASYGPRAEGTNGLDYLYRERVDDRYKTR